MNQWSRPRGVRDTYGYVYTILKKLNSYVLLKVF
jgi:hypothetical protein